MVFLQRGLGARVCRDQKDEDPGRARRDLTQPNSVVSGGMMGFLAVGMGAWELTT